MRAQSVAGWVPNGCASMTPAPSTRMLAGPKLDSMPRTASCTLWTFVTSAGKAPAHAPRDPTTFASR
jgi:hypothetical protein